MKALPGVHSVAFSDELPMIFRATVELRPPERADAVQAVDVYTGSPGFFETVGVPILRGREFRKRRRPVHRGLAQHGAHLLAEGRPDRQDP